MHGVSSSGSRRGPTGGGGWAALARRAKVVLMSVVLVASQVLGMFGGAFAATPAYASDGYDYTFDNGGTVHVSTDGSTVTGECTLSNGHYDMDDGYTADCTMPDGSTLTAHCYERYIGDEMHEWYLGPCDGTYSFTATRQDDGSYFVVVHSQNASVGYNGKPANGIVGHKFQRAYVMGWRVALKVDVSFTKCSADAHVTDGNSEYAYAGAEYDIYKASDDSYVTHIVTDASGHASYKLDAKLAYYAVETKAPLGFKVSSERHYFQTGEYSSDESLADDPGYVRVTVAKKDSATLGEAQPGTTLEGAEFKCVSLSTPGWEDTQSTDANGVLWFKRVPFGDIQIIETKAPNGYKLDSTVHNYTVHAYQITDAGVIELEPEDDFKENPVAFDLEIAKTKGGESDHWEGDDGQAHPAAGVQFQVISNTTHEVVGTLTTNESGFASTRDASTVNAEAVASSATYDASKPWFGKGTRNAGIDGAIPYDEAGYTIHEVESTVPEGFDHVDDWQIGADQEVNGTTKQFSVIDKTLDTHLQVVKSDAETGSTVPLANFTFSIYDASGNKVSMTDWYPNKKVIDEFTTDDSGMVTLPERLASGKYTVREVGAASPYLLSDEGVGFEVSGNYQDATPVTVVSFPDRQAMGRATITKTCSDDGGSLAGAEYDVVARQDVVSPDGTVRASKGQVVDHVTVGDDGKATTRELYLGSGSATYAFVETKAPEGHVLDPTPVEFTLAYKDQSTAVVTAEVTQADKPTELDIDKTVLGTGEALAGAKFRIWGVDGQISVEPDEGHALAVRADAGKVVEARRLDGFSRVTLDAPDGYDVVLKDGEGRETQFADGRAEVNPGSYTVCATKDGHDVELGDAKLDVEAGKAYKLSVKESVFGTKAKVADDGDTSSAVKLDWNADDEAYEAAGIGAGTYAVTIDGTEAGEVCVSNDKAAYASLEDGKLTVQPMLLKGGATFTDLVTDAAGHAVVKHLAKGSYRMVETEAPAGFVESDETFAFTVDERGMTEGVAAYTQQVADDYTKVSISKRDVTNEAEVPGAKLAVRDSDGKVVESWTSTTEDHVINALAPGRYTLTEEMTPNNYDQANTVEFEVKKTGKVQSVVMYDEPIEVSGQIDKRQEIADPTHPYVEADGDGQNKAQVTVSEDGSYDYSLDFRSTSSTWTDEFTVEDDLDGVSAGKATLKSLTTPVAHEDFDGKMNVWYKTDATPTDYVDPSGANATASDGHENPWLADASNKERLGDDGRVIDYTGWRLWRADVPTDEATTLDVSELNLSAGEKVTAIRLEYGRVEKGFTTRDGGWDRDGIKSPHDDVDDVDQSAKANGTYVGEDGNDAPYAPAILHMQVTDDYRGGDALDNSAKVDLYRNGGGDDLEGHDDDEVTQTPAEKLPEIGTTLTDDADGDHSAVESSKVELTDTVAYHGLEVGVEHTVSGTLMDRTTGNPVCDRDGNKVTATATFTPTEPDGTVDVKFAFDASNMAGHDVVAFETMTIRSVETNGDSGERAETDKVVAEHADINDNGQTVRITEPGKGTLAQTGQNLLLAAAVSTAVAGVSGGAYAWRRRKAARAEGASPEDEGTDGE